MCARISSAFRAVASSEAIRPSEKSLMNGNASGFGEKKYTHTRAHTYRSGETMEPSDKLVAQLFASSRELLSQSRGHERGLTSRRSNKMSNNPAGNGIRETDGKIIQDSGGEAVVGIL